ncbi:MAG TPA: RluA family pseudouridine synthase [Polyangiaceae bacterium]|nr:RluA family pseudouridine synthase [Polyangiaceae bacterium]
MKVAVDRRGVGQRLDRFLADTLAKTRDGLSRAEVQRWIDAGRVTIAGAAARGKDILREGTVIDVQPMEPARTELVPDASVPMTILHVDDAVVVLVKPPGVAVHPAPGSEHRTLVHGLLARGLFESEATVPDDADARTRPGIVHRLDKGTSGVMVVARTAQAREALKAQFSAHTIDREYVALCLGVAATATHRTLHGRDPRNRLRFTSRVRSGKSAVTHVLCMEELAGGAACLVRCTLETGRTHQIRMHLAESGTPVLGDPVYGRRSRDARVERVQRSLGHQALHARLLGFEHPTTHARVRFEAPPPPDFAAALDELRGS